MHLSKSKNVPTRLPLFLCRAALTSYSHSHLKTIKVQPFQLGVKIHTVMITLAFKKLERINSDADDFKHFS